MSTSTNRRVSDFVTNTSFPFDENRQDALLQSVKSRSIESWYFMQASKIELTGLRRYELEAKLVELGLSSALAKPLWNGVYLKGATRFSQISSISLKSQSQLEACFTIGRPEVMSALVSSDRTRKWLLQFPDGNRVESVLIPETDRGALCLSSQVGCTLSCSFCHTGTMKLIRICFRI